MKQVLLTVVVGIFMVVSACLAQASESNIMLSENEHVDVSMLFRNSTQTLNVKYEYNFGNEAQRDLYNDYFSDIVMGLKGDNWFSLELVNWNNDVVFYDIFITNEGNKIVIQLERDCVDSQKNCSILVYPGVDKNYVSAVLQALQSLTEIE